MTQWNCQKIIWRHRVIIHHEALAIEDIHFNLMEVLMEGVTIVNVSNGCSVNNWCFKIFCSDIGADPTHLCYCAEVC
jgi:hypothetical protein